MGLQRVGRGWYPSRATKVSKRYGNNNNNFCNSAGTHTESEKDDDHDNGHDDDDVGTRTRSRVQGEVGTNGSPGPEERAARHSDA